MHSVATEPPLEGITVVENCRSVAGSYAGRVLALMGATVIKIEKPGAGDALRALGPFVDDAHRQSALFSFLNVNKSGITLDVGSRRGILLLEELLARADVFLDDTRPSERTRMGLDPARVGKEFPSLLFASLLPFGAFGEHAEYAAHELNTLHSGGEGYLMPNGLALEMFPDRPPVKIYGHFSQFVGGTSAVCAILAGLIAHDQVKGQFLDISVQDANVALSCFNIQRLGEGVLENRHGRSFQYGGVLQCSDGYVGLLTLEQHQWEGLVKLMGEPEWTKAEWLEDPLARGRRGAEINRGIREWARTQKVDDLVARGQAQSVPLAKYVAPDEIVASEQTIARKMFQDVEVAGVGTTQMLTAPFQFTTPAVLKAYAEVPGADNAAVFEGMLGHGAEELAALAAEGVV